MPHVRCPKVGIFKRLQGSVVGFSVLAWLMTSNLAWGQQLRPFTFTPLVNATTHLATFGSHNQKVVVNAYGIFVAYLVHGTPSLDVSYWRLERSVDGGATFTVVDVTPAPGESTDPPVLDTDQAGNIYMIRAQSANSEGPAKLRVYRASTNFASPATEVAIPLGNAQKYSMLVDEARGQLYYIGETIRDAVQPLDGKRTALWFYVIGLDGNLRHDARLTYTLSSNPYIVSSYPQLALDEQGDLYVSWTNIATWPPADHEHRSAHVMRSRDGGSSWQKLSGVPVQVPVASESLSTDPIAMINEPGEIEANKISWGLRVKQGKIHLAYLNPDIGLQGSQRYVRYDTVTGLRDVNLTGWGGQTLQLHSSDGFCTASNKPDNTVYCVGRKEQDPNDPGWDRLAVLASYDNGQTWHDYAVSDHLGIRPWAITGAREIRDGHIVGMVTLPNGENNVALFFRIPVTDRLEPRSVTTSAAAPGYPATKATDGDPATQWVASLNASGANNNAWIQIDLGIAQQIHRIRWQGGAWTPFPAQSPADYTIITSQDGLSWTTVATRTNPAGVINGDEPVFTYARYIRLTTTKVNDGSGWSLSFHEFWVEGLAPTRLPATAYGIQTPGYETALAVDGRYDTQWVASLTPASQNNVDQIILSFDAIKPISRLKWLTAQGTPYPAYAPKDYVIQTSNDGVNWTTIVSRSAPHFMGMIVGSEQIHASARYLRLLTSQVADGSGWSLSFLEFWAEGW